MRRLRTQGVPSGEIDAILSVLLHGLKNEDGNFYFAGSDALPEGLKALADRMAAERSEARGRILTVEPSAGTAVTELEFLDSPNAAAGDLSSTQTVLYSLGLEAGALPNFGATTRLALLAADFYARHLSDGRLPGKNEKGYDELIRDLPQSAFFKAHARFAFGTLPAEKAYDVMRGVERNTNLIRLSAVRPLLQFLNDRLAAARLALQAQTSA